MPELPDLHKLPPIIHFLVASIASTTGLLLTQGFIDNRTEKLISGLAAIWLPMSYMLIVALWQLGHARVTAARINAGLPTTRRLPPS